MRDTTVHVTTDDEFLRLKAVAFFLRTFPMRWGQMVLLVAAMFLLSYSAQRLLTLLSGQWTTDTIVFGAAIGVTAAAYTVHRLYRGITYWDTLRWRLWAFWQSLRAPRPPDQVKPTRFRNDHTRSSIRWVWST